MAQVFRAKAMKRIVNDILYQSNISMSAIALANHIIRSKRIKEHDTISAPAYELQSQVLANWYQTLFITFAYNTDETLIEMDIIPSQIRKLARTKSGKVSQTDGNARAAMTEQRF